ncbi:MAG TPA: ATP-binding protein [Thermoanaerobaculia bacterium]|nr:ATP-binding protein [Thermoanaerobaculia bacterium]
MKRPGRYISRISFRLLAFNLLLVFLPIGGVLLLGEYEARLETGETRAMTETAKIIAAAIAERRGIDAGKFAVIVRRAGMGDVRMRVVDTNGNVIADSEQIVPPPPPRRPRTDRHNLLYRVGRFLFRPILRSFRPPEAPLEVDFYDNAKRLGGIEIVAALHGHEGFDKKITARGQRSVTLYRTVPIVENGRVLGAVVASKSTFTILQDLYAVRLRVMRIFLASLGVAILVSIFFSTTIIKPLRQLRIDAREILDRRGHIRGHFKGSKRLDEVGELSRALERIMRRLDAHVKFIETFASDVSHELKNPLTSIRNANEMLAEVSSPVDQRRFARIIDQEVARMERLLSGVREISTIDAQLVREEPVPVQLGVLLPMIVDGFRLREGDRVRFELVLPDEPLVVEASEDRLIQVFENLLDNAASFSPDGGTVTIHVSREDRAIVTSVSDEGPGIPEANLARIFDRFFTYRPEAPRHHGRHTGLGLAIVKSIVEGYGGAITASPGERGAVFTIRLRSA